jgi:hypothetical protein
VRIISSQPKETASQGGILLPPADQFGRTHQVIVEFRTIFRKVSHGYQIGRTSATKKDKCIKRDDAPRAQSKSLAAVAPLR